MDSLFRLLHANHYFVCYMLSLSLPFRLALADSAVPVSARQLFLECVFGRCTALPAVPCDDCPDRATAYCTECDAKPKPNRKPNPTPAQDTALTTTTNNSTGEGQGQGQDQAKGKGKWLCADHHRVHSKQPILAVHRVQTVREFWSEQRARATASTAAVLRAWEDALALARTTEAEAKAKAEAEAEAKAEAASKSTGRPRSRRHRPNWQVHAEEEKQYALITPPTLAEAGEGEGEGDGEGEGGGGR